MAAEPFDAGSAAEGHVGEHCKPCRGRRQVRASSNGRRQRDSAPVLYFPLVWLEVWTLLSQQLLGWGGSSPGNLVAAVVPQALSETTSAHALLMFLLSGGCASGLRLLLVLGVRLSTLLCFTRSRILVPVISLLRCQSVWLQTPCCFLRRGRAGMS